MIRREFKVELSLVQVGRVLHDIGLSPQKPLYRSYKQKPELVEEWKKVIYPKIRSRAVAEGAMILFGDEASVRTDHHAGTTWAPANKLSKNEHLKAPNGAAVAVVGGTVPKQHDGWMWDLTVPGNNDHDFYVLPAASGTSGQYHLVDETGVTAVLVHNYNCITTGPLDGSGMSDDELLSAAQDARDSLARELGPRPQRTRPAVVTGGYNIETRQFAAAANSAGACAEMCVIDQLGGDAS